MSIRSTNCFVPADDASRFLFARTCFDFFLRQTPVYYPVSDRGGETMSVVYIDLLFFLNLTANYLLLLGAGRLSGAVLKRGRIALSGAAGALYAVLLFLPGLTWLSAWPCKLLSGVLMVLIAYGGERAFLRVTLLFFAASAGLAGLVLAAELLGGTGLILENGALYSVFDLRLLLLIFVICYFVMSMLFRRIGGHSRRELVPLRIVLREHTITVTALLDSGHTLTDSATNRPVVVANAACILPLLPVKLDPAQPVESVRRCHLAGIPGARLVPYRTVGVDCGLLLAVRAAAVTAGERELGALLIALSPTPVDDGGGYQALIGGI